jgi:hypothetical protein
MLLQNINLRYHVDKTLDMHDVKNYEWYYVVLFILYSFYYFNFFTKNDEGFSKFCLSVIQFQNIEYGESKYITDLTVCISGIIVLCTYVVL